MSVAPFPGFLGVGSGSGQVPFNSTFACDLTADGLLCDISGSASAATALILIGGLIGLLFGMYQYMQVKAIVVPGGAGPEAHKLIADAQSGSEYEELAALKGQEEAEVTVAQFVQLTRIYGVVGDGASAFLKAQYGLCCAFTVVFSIVVLVLTSSTTGTDCSVTNTAADGAKYCGSKHEWDFGTGALTATSFAVGAFTSILSGLIGMKVAVFANARVTVEAVKPGAAGWRGSFNAAFIAGSVMGYLLCGLALLMLFILINIFSSIDKYSMDWDPESTSAKRLFECIAGYGLGGSSMALFGRVGGGIFTKAADVGADLSGKVAGVKKGNRMFMLDEDSPLNPATIADNVGDNVGDVAGMGSDLFGSFAEASCAALVISASSVEIRSVGDAAYMFPLLVSATGILVCMLTSFLATHVQKVAKHQDVECVLKVQLFVSALLMTIATLPVALMFLPNKFTFEDLHKISTNSAERQELQVCDRIGAWVCVVCGLWGGCLIGFVTEYYTSHSYSPVREVAQSCESGAATNIIYGLALGYLSCIVPIVLLSLNVFVAFTLCGMYGVSLAALGMLGTLATCLSIDVYGPIADNAGGLAEMAEFPSFVRDKTDALDAAGNTTAAIGKGFAIGSAALVSLALFGGFVSRLAAHAAQGQVVEINVLRPITFAFLFYGAMLPYWFTAYCMKSVGMAAAEMVANVKKQFNEGDQHLYIDDKDELRIKEGAPFPNYQECIDISTKASLREMIAPAMLVMGTPILVGVLFGVEAVSGLLVGSLISAVQLAISQSNSGGAWDNAKKYVEQKQVCATMIVTKAIADEFDELADPNDGDKMKPSHSLIDHEAKVPQGKKTEMHKAAVVGDTVGDPLKDTSGPALNIVMKLMAILSLVFSDFFVSINNGRGAFNMPTDLNLSCPSDGCGVAPH